MKLALMVLVVAGSVVVAHADDAVDAAYDFGKYVEAMEKAKEFIGRIEVDKTPAGCTEVVAKARKLGLKSLRGNFKSIGGKSIPDQMTYEVTLDQADKGCKEYGYYYAIGKYADTWTKIVRDLDTLNVDTAPSPDFVKADLELAGKCAKMADEILAAGVPANLSWKLVGAGPFTVADIKPKFCEALTKAANKFTKDMAAAIEKEKAKYTKYGINGDKLEFMMAYPGRVFLPGRKGPDDMKPYAAASTMFIELSGEPDAADMVTFTVRRYQFSGNKLLKTTEKTYRVHDGEHPDVSAFR